MAAKIGLLALQGAVDLHAHAFSALGAIPVEVRRPAELAEVAGLVIPGGESTTISMLLESSGLHEPLAERLAAGMPTFGTCAGMIVLAREILDGRADQRALGALNISVRRNAFGRQVDSFEADLDIPALRLGPRWRIRLAKASASEPPATPNQDDRLAKASASEPPATPNEDDRFHAVFIRAPFVERVGEGVEVLAAVDGRAVLCRQGPVLASAFHPELTDDLRLHQLFLDVITKEG